MLFSAVNARVSIVVSIDLPSSYFFSAPREGAIDLIAVENRWGGTVGQPRRAVDFERGCCTSKWGAESSTLNLQPLQSRWMQRRTCLKNNVEGFVIPYASRRLQTLEWLEWLKPRWVRSIP